MRLKYVSKEWQLHGFIWPDTIAQNPTQFRTMHVLCERWPLVKALSIWRRRTRPKKTLIKTRARLTCKTCLPRYDELWLLFVKYSSILSQDNSCSVDIQSLSCLVRSLTWGNENNAGRRAGSCKWLLHEPKVRFVCFTHAREKGRLRVCIMHAWLAHLSPTIACLQHN